MSHEKVKSITLKDNKVFLTSADSSIRPLHFTHWECKPLSKIYVEQGREAVLSAIGKDIWNGELHLYKGNRLCNLFIEARNAIPSNLHWSNFDGKPAGEILAAMVLKLEKDPAADLSPERDKMLSLMNDREYILNAAKDTGYNFLNYASVELQKDREFALEVLRAGGQCAWFEYPSQFIFDKEFALEALRLNGCFYRNLGLSLLEDKDIIRLAFDESIETRSFHEHLPDLIPTSLREDKEFMKEVLFLCPGLHVTRTPELLQDKDFALDYVRIGKWMPSHITDVSKEFLDTKDFRDVLINRFGNTDLYETLRNKYKHLGLAPPEVLHKRLNDQILSAESKKENFHSSHERAVDKKPSGDIYRG